MWCSRVKTERDADGKISFCRGQVQEDFPDRTDAVLSVVKCRRCSKVGGCHGSDFARDMRFLDLRTAKIAAKCLWNPPNHAGDLRYFFPGNPQLQSSSVSLTSVGTY